MNAGVCTGTFASPQVEAGGIVSYGLHVRCTGTGSLPLSAQIRLQEEHLGAVYETVDETSKNLTEGGYGLFVEKRSVTQLLQGMIIELMERFLQESIMTLVSPKKSIFHAM